MNNELNDFTFLTKEQTESPNRLKVLQKYGLRMSVTDFSILLGAKVSNAFIFFWYQLKDRTCTYYLSDTPEFIGSKNTKIYAITEFGGADFKYVFCRDYAARPATKYSNSFLDGKVVMNLENGVKEIVYGEYPQMAVSEEENELLENLYSRNSLLKTGKGYTTDSVPQQGFDKNFEPMRHEEFVDEFGDKYIRVISDKYIHDNCNTRLCNGVLLGKESRPFWIQVQPITWLLDEESNTLISKKGLFSGMKINSRHFSFGYDGNFNNTEVKLFMDTFFSKEINQEETMNLIKKR